jgi:flagellar assembly factor FliW
MKPLAHPLSNADAAPVPSIGAELARDVIRFPSGLPGFEACRGFVLMASDSLGPVQCLKAIEGPAASFLVIDPRRVLPEFRCELSAADMHRLGVGPEDRADETLLWLVLLTVETDGTITANLRAPVVINPKNMVGQQVVPYQCVYPIRHVIAAGV